MKQQRDETGSSRLSLLGKPPENENPGIDNYSIKYIKDLDNQTIVKTYSAWK